MSINSEKDIQLLKRIGLIVSQVLKEMRQQTKPGMNTKQLDEIGITTILRNILYNFSNLINFYT